MDKVNEILTWLMFVAFGCWFAANKTVPAVDQSAPEVASAAGPTTPEATGALSDRIDTSRTMASCEGSLIAAGLSEMMGRRKIHRGLKRRKEDKIS